MFESLVITLREGVEAALVLAIALAVLERRNLSRLRGPLFWGAGAAVAASIVVAALGSRLTYNQELAEGIARLTGAVLVASLAWWMQRTGPNMKREIEEGVHRATGGDSGGGWGVFLFSFGMLFREGVETAIFLSATSFDTRGLGQWIGAAIGLALAATFGVLFVRGSLKVPLKAFFSLTSAVLVLLAIQLLVGGLHELSEAEVIPSSKAEMALIGPFVKNELLLFTLTVALAAGWLLAGAWRVAPAPAAADSGPAARLARAGQSRDRSLRRWTGIVGLLVVGFLTTAFVRQAKQPERVPGTPVVIAAGEIKLDPAPLRDGHVHFFETTIPEGPVRFFAIDVQGDLRTCFDACVICGDMGYFEDGGTVVCRNCTSPIVLGTLGRAGGCNPIPLPHRIENGRVVVAEQDLRTAWPQLKGR